MKEPTAVDSEYRKLEGLLARVRARNTEQFAVSPKSGIDEASYVSIGGIEQWVTIRGQDRANPVLLFLHGGPGDVTNPWTFALFAPWEKLFTVVQWDQRGAGRTLRRTGPAVAPTMTLDRMMQDGIEVAEYLRTHLRKDKIIVVAHSFGSIFGMRMVSARPDLFCAYVGTGLVADETRNYSVAYDALLRKAQATASQPALDDLRRVGPPPYKSGEGYRVQRKWANSFEGADQFLYGTIGLRSFAVVTFTVPDGDFVARPPKIVQPHGNSRARRGTTRHADVDLAQPGVSGSRAEEQNLRPATADSHLRRNHAAVHQARAMNLQDLASNGGIVRRDKLLRRSMQDRTLAVS
jgi:pimeloyl-ACP methyl ester carboxylesterase